MALSATWEGLILQIATGQVAHSTFTPQLALYTTMPTMPAGTGGVEVSGGAYARQNCVFGAPTGSGPAVSSNSALITFPTATANWGTIVGMGIIDASGNIIDASTLQTSKTIGTGDVFSVPIGNYTINQT